MRKAVVRYKVKPGKGDENQKLVEAVFAELVASGLDPSSVSIDATWTNVTSSASRNVA